MRFQRTSSRIHSAPAVVPGGLPQRVQRHDLGGMLNSVGDTLADVVPALSVPYIAVQQATGPNLRGIDSKMMTKSEDNLATLAQETDKVWNEKMKTLDILPVYQKKLSEYRNNFLKNVQDRVRQDGSFLSSTANRLQVQQSFLAALDSPEIKIMTQNSKEFDKWWEEKKSKHKEDDQFYLDGKRSGMTNASYYRTLRNRSDSSAEALLGGFGGPDSPVGTMQLNTRIGSFADNSIKEIDEISGLAQASTNGGSTKTFDINSTNQQLLGSRDPQVYGHLRASSIKTNGQALSAMASYYGNNWRSRLSKESVEGLEDQYDNEFSRQGAYPYVVQRTDGEILQPGTERIASLEAAARAGQLRNPQQVLDTIDQQRRQYVDKQASNYIKTRIMGRLSQDKDYKSEETLESRGNALTKEDGEKAAAEGEFEKGAIQRNVGGVNVDVVNPDGPGQSSWFMIAPSVKAQESRDKLFLGYSLDTFRGRQLGMFGRPGQDLTGQLVETSNMRVIATKGDAAQNVNTSPVVFQLDQNIAQAQARLNNFKAGQVKPAEKTALAAQISLMMEQREAAVDQGKSRLQHVVRVAMPLSTASKNPLFMEWKEKNQEKGSLLRQGYGFGAYDTVDETKLGGNNPYGIEYRKLTPAEAKIAGYALPKADDDGQQETKEAYVMMDMLVQGQTQDMYNESAYKGRENLMGREGANQYRGEINKTVVDATWLNQYTNPFATPAK